MLSAELDAMLLLAYDLLMPVFTLTAGVFVIETYVYATYASAFVIGACVDAISRVADDIETYVVGVAFLLSHFKKSLTC